MAARKTTDGYPGRRISRRTVLRGAAGVAVSLPFLNSVDPVPARAQTGDGPTRLLLFSHIQGWAMGDSMPDASFNLPPVLTALEPVKDKVLVLSGIDNRVGGGGHNPTQRSQFTAMPAYGSNQYFDNIFASGPSIDQIIADRLAMGGPPRRLDLVTLADNSGRLDPVDSRFFWHGDADPVTHIADPREAFARVFGDSAAGEDAAPEIDRLRLRRRSVLDTVLGHFNHLRQRVSSDDRQRLDQHADKIRQLEGRLDDMRELLNVASCQDRPVVPELPDPAAVVTLLPDIADLMIDIAVLATACGASDVATVMQLEGTYEWLGSDLVNREMAGSEGRYHLLFHKFSDNGDNGAPRQATNIVNQWNVGRFARYLQGLEAIPEAEDSTALDSTLAVLVPEFGNGGGHNSNNLPCILAGNFGSVRMGRHLSFVEDLESNWDRSTTQTTNQLLVSILNAFGDPRESFGDYSEGSIPTGGLTGLA